MPPAATAVVSGVAALLPIRLAARKVYSPAAVTVVESIIDTATVAAALVSPELSGIYTAPTMTTCAAPAWCRSTAVVIVGSAEVPEGDVNTAAATMAMSMIETATVRWILDPHPLQRSHHHIYVRIAGPPVRSCTEIC